MYLKVTKIMINYLDGELSKSTWKTYQFDVDLRKC